MERMHRVSYVGRDVELPCSYHIGNSKVFRSSEPEMGMKTKYIFLIINSQYNKVLAKKAMRAEKSIPRNPKQTVLDFCSSPDLAWFSSPLHWLTIFPPTGLQGFLAYLIYPPLLKGTRSVIVQPLSFFLLLLALSLCPIPS